MCEDHAIHMRDLDMEQQEGALLVISIHRRTLTALSLPCSWAGGPPLSKTGAMAALKAGKSAKLTATLHIRMKTPKMITL